MFPCTSSGQEVFHFPSSVFFWLYREGKRGSLRLMWWTVRRGTLQKWKLSSVIVLIPRWNFYQHHNLWITDKIPEIERSIGEDSSNRDWKSIVKSCNTVFFEYFCAAVDQTIELSLCFWFSDISSQSCSCEIKRIDEDQTETSCNTSWEQWHWEILSLVNFGVYSLQKDLIEVIFGGEVDSLSGEVSYDICPVSSP